MTAARPLTDEHRQHGYRVRFDWGPYGLRALGPVVDVVVVVDVLSFSTCIDVAVGRGAVVLPYRWHNGTEDEYAAANRAVVAGPRSGPGYTLSPASLEDIPPGTRLVLPSPNGSALAFGAREAGAGRVVIGSLRNAPAVGRWLRSAGASIAVLAAGERWRGATGPLRPAVEDLLGAGAVVDAIGVDDCSPEAAAAAAAFRAADLETAVAACASGRELVAEGFDRDVELAAAFDVSPAVPVLDGDEITSVEG